MLKIILLTTVLFVGIGLIIKGGDFVVSVCGKLSDLTGINEALIGATITSFATTLPELIITVLGMSQNSVNLILGNVFGTILVNICLVLGISLIFMRLLRINKKTINKITFMIGLIIFISLLVLLKGLNIISGAILIIIFFAYLIKNYLDIKNELSNKDSKVIVKKKISAKSKISEILKFIVGLLFIFAGAQIVVNSSENLSILLNINSTLIGLIILAIGTSLPELITSLTSIKKKRLNLALGNIVGSNVINLSLLLGLSGVMSGFTGLTLNAREIAIILPSILIASFILCAPIFIKKRTYKWQGITLISLYAIYCIFIILII